MAIPPATGGTTSDDARNRNVVLLLLRLGLGFNLLNAGLIHYVRMRPGFPRAGYTFLVPYLEIAVGLGLALGLFTTTAAILAGILVLVQPLMQTIHLLSGGFPPVGRAPLASQALLESGTAGNLLLVCVLLWFSSPGLNPWSLDALIFVQREGIRAALSRAPGTEPPARGDEPGSLIATSGGSADHDPTARPRNREP